MAREELISGNNWEQYSEKVQERMNNPMRMGVLNQSDADKINAKLITTDIDSEYEKDNVKLFWLIDETTNTIVDSTFTISGCNTAIACSDAMAQLCIGKKIDDVAYITSTEIEGFLRDDINTPSVPLEEIHYFTMVADLIAKLVTQYKDVSEEEVDNSHIVCDCTRKSKEEIITIIKENNITAVEDIIRISAAGAYCKSCVRPGGQDTKDEYLIDILEEVKETIKNEKVTTEPVEENKVQSDTNSFDKMSIVQRIKAVDAVIDEFIRPMLVMDGGDMEIIDIKENIPHYDIYIRYLGACGSCSSGTTGTLYAIETTLQQKIDENIRVLPV